MMILAAATTLRWMFLIGMNLLVLAVPIPNLPPVWRTAGIVVSAALSMLFWRALVRPRQRGGEPELQPRSSRVRHVSDSPIIVVLSLALHAAMWLLLDRIVPDAPDVSDATTNDLCAAAFGVMVFIGMHLLWWWARPVWRFLVSACAGVTLGGWFAVFGAYHGASSRDVLGHVHASRFLPVVVLLFATTAIATFANPERRVALRVSKTARTREPDCLCEPGTNHQRQVEY